IPAVIGIEIIKPAQVDVSIRAYIYVVLSREGTEAIIGARRRIVKDRVERAGGNAFFSRNGASAQHKLVERQLAEKAARTVVIGVFGDTEVVRGGIELGKEELLAGAGVVGSREQQFEVSEL